jgi:hypothetical protein
MAAVREGERGTAPAAGGDGLVAWAARSGRPQAGGPVRGGLRFVFYGRVSTEDWQAHARGHIDFGNVDASKGYANFRAYA